MRSENFHPTLSTQDSALFLMMTANRKHNSFTFEKIKQGLDPAHSYMIFEKVIEDAAESAFKEVFQALSRMDFGFYERQVLRDEARGRLLLIVKFGPGRIDSIMQEFLNIGLPEDITFYAYGSHSTG
jgi:hypothetical protein